MRLMLLGPPGVGKGTQAKLLATEYKVPHISTGDILRQEVRDGTELGRKAKEYMERGALVPDELILAMFEGRLEKDDTRAGFIADGFPRTIPQAEAFDQMLARRGQRLEAVVTIEAPLEELVRRSAGRRVCRSCGAPYNVYYQPSKVEGVCEVCGGELYQRDDDREATVRRRQEVYRAETAPLIAHYEQQGLVRRVDGSQPVEEVLASIKRILATR
ncbi:MAG TPA: adenylate kinase [Bacillota bacterium]